MSVTAPKEPEKAMSLGQYVAQREKEIYKWGKRACGCRQEAVIDESERNA